MNAADFFSQVVVSAASAATGVTVAAWRLSRELERIRARLDKLEAGSSTARTK